MIQNCWLLREDDDSCLTFNQFKGVICGHMSNVLMKNSETVCFVSPVPVIMLWDWYWQTFYLFKWPEKLFSCWIYHVWQCDKTHIFNKLTQPQFISQVLSRLEGNILKISRKFLANLKLHILLKDIGTRKRKFLDELYLDMSTYSNIAIVFTLVTIVNYCSTTQLTAQV